MYLLPGLWMKTWRLDSEELVFHNTPGTAFLFLKDK